MADRLHDQFQQTLVRGLVSLFVDVQFNGSSAPTIVQASYANPAKNTWATAPASGTRWGGLTFVRNTTGDYTLTLVNKYTRVLSYTCTFLSNTSTAAPISQIKVASNPNTAGSTTAMGWTGASGAASLNAVELLFFSAQGTAADPAATEFATLSFQLLNSGAN